MDSRIPWERLGAAQFEEFCAEVLRSLGLSNVRARGSTTEPDDGFDLTGLRRIEDGPLTEQQEWRAQCKYFATGHGSISRPQVAQTMGVTPSHVHAVTFITNGRVSNPGMRLVTEKAGPPGPRYFVIDKQMLEEMLLEPGRESLRRFFPGFSTELRPSATLAEQYVAASARAWDPELRLDTRLQEMRQTLLRFRTEHPGDFGPAFNVMYEFQRQRVVYRPDGWSETQYHMKLLNIGHAALDTERLTIYGALPVATDAMDLRIYDVSTDVRREINWHPILDTDTRKVIEFAIPDGLQPLHPFEYVACLQWPFRMPLAGKRYLEILTWALSQRVEFEICVPLDHPPRAAQLILGTSLRDLAIHRLPSSWAIADTITFPSIAAVPRVEFVIGS